MQTAELKLLAIDDNQDNLTALKAVAKDALPGCTVLTALDGPTGLEIARAEDPDVILLDIVMPGMDGFAVCRELKADERLRSTPVLFLTALRTDGRSRVKALEAGAEGFLSKPWNESELVAQIRAMAKIQAANRLRRLEKEELASLVAERTRQLEQELAERKRVEEGLRESEERYRALFENNLDAALLTAPDGRIFDANPAACHLFGRTKEEICALGRDGLVAADDPRLPRLLEERARTGRASGELTFVRRDGSQFAGEVSSVLFRDRSGSPRTSMIIRDVTERNRAQEALRKSEEKHRIVADLTYDWEYWVAPDGTPLYVSPACERISGHRREEFLADPGLMTRIIHPEDKGRFAAHAQEVRREQKFSSCEFRIIRADGEERWIGHVCVPVFDPHGVFLGKRASNHDITERKMAEAERERLMTAIEQAGEVIFVTDPKGKIQYVNPAFEVVTGYSGRDVLGQTPHLLKSGKHDDAFYRDLWKTVLSGQTWQGQIVNKRKDGTLYTEEAIISPVRDAQGRIVNCVSVARDVTEHLRLSEQLRQAQKIEAIGRLAGGVAHDFNNLLTVILGLAELAASELAPQDPLLAHIQGIQGAGARAADLTRQLLAFARKQVVSPRALDLNEAVSSLQKMLSRLIGEDIAFVWKPHPALWTVRIDPSQLDQLLANLAVNARDAMAGSGTLNVATGNAVLDEAYCAVHPGATSGEYVRLTVADTGCGMDRETLSQIFEPFFTTKGEGGGTGLGLATVYGIVKQAGGYIEVNSEPGVGTSFYIYLPRWEGQAAPAPGPNERTRPLRGSETVLLVEDEKQILELGRSILERCGYRVLAARTPGEAILLAEKHPEEIRLLATDVVMPGMNGRELCERLRALRPDLKCLFLSGYTADAIAQRGVLPDGVNFLQKPYSIKALTEKVRALLDG